MLYQWLLVLLDAAEVNHAYPVIMGTVSTTGSKANRGHQNLSVYDSVEPSLEFFELG